MTLGNEHSVVFTGRQSGCRPETQLFGVASSAACDGRKIEAWTFSVLTWETWIIGILDRIKRTLAGDGIQAEQLDEPTLKRHVVKGILKFRHRGSKGVNELPAAVHIDIKVSTGSIEVVRRMVDSPGFDEEVEASLLNELAGNSPRFLPIRHYRVVSSDETLVTVEEARDDTLIWLRVEGGDRDGEWLAYKASSSGYRLGRSAWHGPEDTESNDFVISNHDAFVSRRAARLSRAGTGLEVETRDQGDYLVVLRADGSKVRPARVASQKVKVKIGDVIDFIEGREGPNELSEQYEGRIRLHLSRRGPEEDPSP